MSIRNDHEATSMPEGNRQAIRRFDLTRLSAGETVVITTRSSTYWVTATKHLRLAGTSVEIRGASVVTNSVRAGRFTKDPDNTRIGRYVEIGEGFVIGRKADFQHALTSRVESISIK